MAYASIALSNKTATPFHTVRKRLKEAEDKDRRYKSCKAKAKRAKKKPSKACLNKRKAALAKLASAKKLHAHFKKKGGKSYAKKAASASRLIKSTQKKLKPASKRFAGKKVSGKKLSLAEQARRAAAVRGHQVSAARSGSGVSEFDEFDEFATDEFEPAGTEDFEMAAEDEYTDMPLDEDFEDFGDEESEGIPMWMIGAGVLGAGGLIWFLSGR